jgi:protein-tyrosine phosphatase
MTQGNGQLSEKQAEYVDIHCHCLPAVDDGPKNIYESLALCQSFVDDGISVAIATPHQLGQFDGCNTSIKIRQAVSELNRELESNNIPLTIMPGGDVRIDERICKLIETDEILTLADGKKYILLELPSEIFIDIESLLCDLADMGIHSIISHPERHFVLNRQYNILQKWLRHPVYLQITAGSLIGEFGQKAKAAAWKFLSLGWTSFVATDAHNLNGRRPQMKTAYKHISMKLGQKLAHTVCIENPIRVLEGREIATHYKELFNAKSI